VKKQIEQCAGSKPAHKSMKRQRDPVAEFLDVLARLIAQHHLRVSRDELAPPDRKKRRRQAVPSNAPAASVRLPENHCRASAPRVDGESQTHGTIVASRRAESAAETAGSEVAVAPRRG
jgi:hypothetical protein